MTLSRSIPHAGARLRALAARWDRFLARRRVQAVLFATALLVAWLIQGGTAHAT